MKEWQSLENIANSILKYRKNIKNLNRFFGGTFAIYLACTSILSVFSFLSVGFGLGILATVFLIGAGGVTWAATNYHFLSSRHLENEQIEGILAHFLEDGDLPGKTNLNFLKAAIVKQEETVKTDNVLGSEIKLTSIYMMKEGNQPIHLCQGKSGHLQVQSYPTYVGYVDETPSKWLKDHNKVTTHDLVDCFLLEKDETIEDVKKYYLERKN